MRLSEWGAAAPISEAAGPKVLAAPEASPSAVAAEA
jgi:hypothetical protein